MEESPRRQTGFADCLDLLRVFDEREAETLIVGGQAVNFWAEVFEAEEPVGIEIDALYFTLAKKAIPQLAALYPTFQGKTTELEADYAPAPPNGDQLALALADKPPQVLPGTKPRPSKGVQPLSYKKPAAAA